ncbi:MAG: hypothetical protein EB060_01125 [Proteobacteria bacterium]|nr:hypothetical protein [Pseudomonadota bacterium]
MGGHKKLKQQILDILERTTGIEWSVKKDYVRVDDEWKKEFVFTPSKACRFKEPWFVNGSPGLDSVTAESQTFHDQLAAVRQPQFHAKKPEGLRWRLDFTFEHPDGNYFVPQLLIRKAELFRPDQSTIEGQAYRYGKIIAPVVAALSPISVKRKLEKMALPEGERPNHMLTLEEFAEVLGVKTGKKIAPELEALWEEIGRAYALDADNPLLREQPIDCEPYKLKKHMHEICVSEDEVALLRGMLGQVATEAPGANGTGNGNSYVVDLFGDPVDSAPKKKGKRKR